MTRWPRVSLSPALFLVALSVQPSRAGNTTCVSRQLDWYTSVVGESPCMTYQRLRQICNNEYQVPTFKSTVPGDLCNDQVSTCCSNTIAFQLSMLCMVCQQDTQDTGGIGIDAPKGSFGVYINGTTPAQNHTLPDDLQRAVCNENIRLDDFLYGGWDDGAWYYVYTKENAELGHASNGNNTFTRCPNQISSSSTAKSASLTSKSASPTSKSASSRPTEEAGGTVTTSTSTKSTSRGALIGGIVGGILGLTVLVIAAIVWMRMRRRTVSGKGSEWSQNPRFTYMHSSTQASRGAPKSLLAQSKYSMGGPLSSGFSYRDPDCVSVAGSCTTHSENPSWSNATTRPPSSPARVEPFPRPEEKASLDRPLCSNPRSFSEVYGTGSSEGSQYSTTDTQLHSGEAHPGSVSLSTFDFAGSQVPDDGQTTRSFPRSVMANGHTAVRGPSLNDSRRPAYGRNTNTGAPESRDRWHYT